MDNQEDEYAHIEEIFDQAVAAPEGRAKIRLFREAIRIADGIQDLELQYEVRTYFVEAAARSGDARNMMVELTWCVSAFDENPDRFDAEELIELMRWGLTYAPHFHVISRQSIESLEADFEKRCRAEKLFPRVMNLELTRSAIGLCDKERAVKRFEQFEDSPRGDARADQIELIFRADYYSFLEDWEKLIKICETVLGEKRYRGADNWDNWLSMFGMLALQRAGRTEDAMKLHKIGYREAKKNPRFLSVICEHVIFLTTIQDLSTALKILGRHVGWLDSNCSTRTRMILSLCCWKLFDALSNAGIANVEITFPSPFLPELEGTDHCTRRLAGFFDADANQIAKNFDERNGNTWESEYIRSNF